MVNQYTLFNFYNDNCPLWADLWWLLSDSFDFRDLEHIWHLYTKVPGKWMFSTWFNKLCFKAILLPQALQIHPPSSAREICVCKMLRSSLPVNKQGIVSQDQATGKRDPYEWITLEDRASNKCLYWLLFLLRGEGVRVTKIIMNR